MNEHIFTPQTVVNGTLLQSSQMSQLAFSGFAHFTAMQVRDGMVKGMDLHLDRLRHASVELFGQALSDEEILTSVRTAIAAAGTDLSLTVTLYSSHGEFTLDSMDTQPNIMVRTGAPANGPSGPLKLLATEYCRPLPEIKHVGEISKTYYLHKAAQQGYDDAVFIDDTGCLSEGTIWNLAFWDGETVIWPQAPKLQGTMMSMVQRQLRLLNIEQRTEPVTLASLPSLRGAVVMNSWTPGVEVAEISGHSLKESESLSELLHQAYTAEPMQAI
ncbi:aminotransferase class IV family protein [Pseudoalteromonas ardens]|uniref:Aminotransferase, class IV n=1 Tax=Pseudoalteromonas rubra TaxID=43658 RepID=A0A0L0ELM6_9GAMM|nr:aminotransferase class IV family protein [Pseudoalteromonas sp. R96]KNC65364.1 aminotransferase, class IV [Pseudoalteromonas rubra]MDK1310580.1 aminotransferase class IV family protein [Pseudoalteromonas sp. R96]